MDKYEQEIVKILDQIAPIIDSHPVPTVISVAFSLVGTLIQTSITRCDIPVMTELSVALNRMIIMLRNGTDNLDLTLDDEIEDDNDDTKH